MAIDLAAVRRKQAERLSRQHDESKQAAERLAAKQRVAEAALKAAEGHNGVLIGEGEDPCIAWAAQIIEAVRLADEQGGRPLLCKAVCLSIVRAGATKDDAKASMFETAAGIIQLVTAWKPAEVIGRELREETQTRHDCQRLHDGLYPILETLTQVFRASEFFPKLTISTVESIRHKCDKLRDGLPRDVWPEFFVEAPSAIADAFDCMRQLDPESPEKPKWAAPMERWNKRQQATLLDGKPWWTVADVEAATATALAWCEERTHQNQTLTKGESRKEAKRRPEFVRDHEWLRQYEAKGERTYHSHAAIRDEWNTKAGNRVTREVVIEGIKKAKAERKNGMG